MTDNNKNGIKTLTEDFSKLITVCLVKRELQYSLVRILEKKDGLSTIEESSNRPFGSSSSSNLGFVKKVLQILLIDGVGGL